MKRNIDDTLTSSVEVVNFQCKRRLAVYLVFWLDLRCKLSYCSYFVQGEEVDYRGVLHRDGSVLMSVSLDMLKVCVAFM